MIVLAFLEKIPTKVLPLALIVCTLLCVVATALMGILYYNGFRLVLLLFFPFYALLRFAFACISNELKHRDLSI